MTVQVPDLPSSTDCLDQNARQSFLDTHLWIVEEELRMYIGRPPWFDSALCFVLVEIVGNFARRKAPRKCAHWIRAEARRAARTLERTLADRHAKDAFVQFTGCESFQAVVGSVLRRQRSLYWAELRLPKSLSSRCGPLKGAD
jgi:hypothetical protein